MRLRELNAFLHKDRLRDEPIDSDESYFSWEHFLWKGLPGIIWVQAGRPSPPPQGHPEGASYESRRPREDRGRAAQALARRVFRKPLSTNAMPYTPAQASGLGPGGLAGVINAKRLVSKGLMSATWSFRVVDVARTVALSASPL